MADVKVAEPVLPIPMAYNSQQENSSQYQKRTVNYLYPSQSGELNSSSGSSLILRFLVGSQFFLDTKNSYFVGDVQLKGATGGDPNNPTLDTVYFNDNTDTWVKRITITTPQGVLIEEIRDADVLALIQTRECEEQYIIGEGRECNNMASRGDVNLTSNSLTNAQRKALALLKRRYVFKLNQSGFLHSFNLLPLRAMSQGQSNSFQIEIEFNSPQNMITAYETATGEGNSPQSNASYNYSISNFYYVQSLLEDNVMEEYVTQLVKTKPLILSYPTYRHYANIIAQSSNSSQSTISISEYQESVQELKVIFRNNAKVNNQTYDSTYFVNPNLIQVQLQVGPTYYPSQPLVCANTNSPTNYEPKMAELYSEFVKCSQKFGMKEKGFNPASYLAIPYHLVNASNVNSSLDYTDLIIPFDLRIFGDNAVGDPRYNQYFSGVNLKSNPQPLQFIFLYNPSLVSPQTNANLTSTTFVVDSFTKYRSNLFIQAGESYVIS